MKVVVVQESDKATMKFGAFEKDHDILVISYDQLKIHIETLKSVITTIGLVVCDEGHRLKNNKIKTSQAVNAIPCARRVILSGTPIQNDLGEFYAMVNFVNSQFLGSEDAFSNVFNKNIMKGRNEEDDEENKGIIEKRTKTIIERAKIFILRRTQVVNRQYLPPKGI